MVTKWSNHVMKSHIGSLSSFFPFESCGNKTWMLSTNLNCFQDFLLADFQLMIELATRWLNQSTIVPCNVHINKWTTITSFATIEIKHVVMKTEICLSKCFFLSPNTWEILFLDPLGNSWFLSIRTSQFVFSMAIIEVGNCCQCGYPLD